MDSLAYMYISELLSNIGRTAGVCYLANYTFMKG